jgi:DNA-binding transcriptional regulator GbsR (MarR family)
MLSVTFMKLNVDDKLLIGYNRMKERASPYTLKDFIELCGYSKGDYLHVSQQLQKMWKLGMLHKFGEGRQWTLAQGSIESWFKAYLKGTLHRKINKDPIDSQEIKNVIET